MTLLIVLLTFATPLVLAQGYTFDDVAMCSLNREFKLEKENYLESKAAEANARARFYPTLEAGVLPNSNRIGDRKSNSTIGTLSIEQRLLDFENWSLKKGAKATVNSAFYGLLNRGYETSISAIREMALIQKSREEIELSSMQLDSFRLSREIMKTTSRIALTDSNDLLQLEANILDLESEIERLKYSLIFQESTFVRSYGYRPLNITDIHRPNHDLPKIEIKKLPAIRIAQFDTEASEQQQKAYQNRLIPSLSLRGSYASIGNSWPSYVADNYPQSDVSISLNLDFSNLWKENTQRNMQNSIVSTRKNRYKFQTDVLQNQFDQILLELENLKKRMPLMQRRLELALESKKVSSAKLRLGRISFLELQQTEQVAYNAALSKLILELRKIELEAQLFFAQKFSYLTSVENHCALLH